MKPNHCEIEFYCCAYNELYDCVYKSGKDCKYLTVNGNDEDFCTSAVAQANRLTLELKRITGSHLPDDN